MKITIAGTGYVGLSNAILLAQHNDVIALDIIQEKVDMINNKRSPIIDNEIEEYLATKELNLSATTDNFKAYKNADYVIISTPTIMIRRKTISILELLKRLSLMYYLLIQMR
jgi:UDPglucose 6-dehydrogenase